MADTENSIETEGIPEIELELEVRETVQAPVDATLSIAGQAADAKATGDAIAALRTETNAAIDALFPVGAIYISISDEAPEFFGVWEEILIPTTWGDLEDGMRSFVAGKGTGTLHFWKRKA